MLAYEWCLLLGRESFRHLHHVHVTTDDCSIFRQILTHDLTLKLRSWSAVRIPSLEIDVDCQDARPFRVPTPCIPESQSSHLEMGRAASSVSCFGHLDMLLISPGGISMSWSSRFSFVPF
jgi:hypothetical protein